MHAVYRVTRGALLRSSRARAPVGGLFCSTPHTEAPDVWMHPLPLTSPAHASLVDVDVGLTAQLLDAIGDVEAIEWTAPVEPQRVVARLSWSGFTRTASDELYHAVWANARGVRSVALPVSGTVLARNEQVGAAPRALDEHTWLVKLRVDREELERWRATRSSLSVWD